MIRNLIPVNPAIAIGAMGYEAYRQYGGWLISSRSRVLKHLSDAPVWAADNDCFSDWNPTRFERFLGRVEGMPNCLFVNAPDVVCDAAATLERFEDWQPVIAGYGLPVAFTLQNGIQTCDVPWDRIQAVFIGGDTLFKFSRVVKEIAWVAKRRGLWIHMGRVNSGIRIQHSAAIGCDSFDGLSYKYSVNIAHDLRYQKLPKPTHSQRIFPCF